MRLLLVLAFIAAFFTACSAQGTSVAPTLSGSAVKPQVWEEGPLPEQWQFFGTAYFQPDTPVDLSWIVADQSRHVWIGVTQAAFPEPCLLSYAAEMNFSGTRISSSVTRGCGDVMQHLIIGSDGQTVYTAEGHDVDGTGPLAGFYDDAYQVNRMAQGPNRDLYFTCNCPGYIVRLRNWTPLFYHYPKTDIAQNVAVDNDNRVWVVLSEDLALLNPNTVVHFKVFPFKVTSPQLLVGPDNNLWFVSGAVLSRITTGTSSPELTRFTLPVSATTGYLATGPDGNLWLGYRPNGIGSAGLLNVTLAGKVVNKYVCPISVCNPANGDSMQPGITSASDGNVWFLWSGGSVANDPDNGIVTYVRLSMNVVPSSVTFPAVGATQALTVSETNYSGTWTAASTVPSVAKVLSVSGHTVEIQAVHSGHARIIITDAKTNYVGIPVTVP